MNFRKDLNIAYSAFSSNKESESIGITAWQFIAA